MADFSLLDLLGSSGKMNPNMVKMGMGLMQPGSFNPAAPAQQAQQVQQAQQAQNPALPGLAAGDPQCQQQQQQPLQPHDLVYRPGQMQQPYGPMRIGRQAY